MTKITVWWRRIINSRFLAVLGGATLLLFGGYAVTAMAQAQGVTYTVISTDTLNSLQNQINSLAARVSTLEGEVANLQSARHIYEPVGNQTTYVVPTVTQPNIPNTGSTVQAATPVVIDQDGETLVAGFDIYLTGRGFAPFEPVLIMRNGVTVGHITTDAGGNISSNGILLPLGPSTFTLVGQTSGITATANVHGATSVI